MLSRTDIKDCEFRYKISEPLVQVLLLIKTFIFSRESLSDFRVLKTERSWGCSSLNIVRIFCDSMDNSSRRKFIVYFCWEDSPLFPIHNYLNPFTADSLFPASIVSADCGIVYSKMLCGYCKDQYEWGRDSPDVNVLQPFCVTSTYGVSETAHLRDFSA